MPALGASVKAKPGKTSHMSLSGTPVVFTYHRALDGRVFPLALVKAVRRAAVGDALHTNLNRPVRHRPTGIKDSTVSQNGKYSTSS